MSAHLYVRPRLRGGASIQVKWRDRSLGRWQSETFDGFDAAAAAEFRAAVTACGDRWPAGWNRGQGWARNLRDVRTLDDVYRDWVAWQQGRVAKNLLKPATLARYRADYRHHVRDHLGHVDFAALDTAVIEEWLSARLAERAAKSVKNVYGGVLAPVVKHGVLRMRLRLDNPCDAVEPPRRDPSSKQIRFFQPEEWELFRACLFDDVHDLVDTLLATALRWGEASALQVGDLADGPQGQLVIHVRRAWAARGTETDRDLWLPGETARWEISHPKTRTERVVVVTGPLADRLRRLRTGRSSDDWLFTTARGNPWRHRDFYSDRWTPARRHAARYGLDRRFTPHMLRHTCVVWSLHRGVPIEVVSHMLGHSSIKTTYDEYGGLLHLTDDRMAQAMSAAMSTSAHVPTPTPDEVAARKVRPGTRRDVRRRSAA